MSVSSTVLYRFCISIPAFQEFVQQLSPINEVVLTIQNLFRHIDRSIVPVRTSMYVQNLGLDDYTFGNQYDAHECLLKVLNTVYPTITNDSIFKSC